MRYWKCIKKEIDKGFTVGRTDNVEQRFVDDVGFMYNKEIDRGFTVGRTYTTDNAGQRFVDDVGFMYSNDIRTLRGVVFEEIVYN